MKAVAALMAVLIAPAAAWMPVAPSRVGVALEARGKGKASTADVVHKKDLVRAIKRSTKETMPDLLNNKAFEGYVKSRGDKSHPKLMKSLNNKAAAFGVEVPAKWGARPWTGPALWEKGKAAEALKAAMAAKDATALAAAIEATDNLEGVDFVKVAMDAKGKPLSEQPTTACSQLLEEAKALAETLDAPPAPEEEAPAEEAPAEAEAAAE